MGLRDGSDILSKLDGGDVREESGFVVLDVKRRTPDPRVDDELENPEPVAYGGRPIWDAGAFGGEMGWWLEASCGFRRKA